MRLIDADELFKKLSPNYDETKQLIKEGETHLDTLAEGYTEVSILINDAPTIEAVVVKHGHWVDDNGFYKCSCCGELWMHWFSCDIALNEMTHKIKYCPNCGSKMSEKEY